ncbi:MAG: hypothetical protein RLZZ347_626 [Candidatus Parcubacteria bacterium]|jgi:hypothetical protein
MNSPIVTIDSTGAPEDGKWQQCAKSFHDWTQWAWRGYTSEGAPSWFYQHWVSLGYADPRKYRVIGWLLRVLNWTYIVAAACTLYYGGRMILQCPPSLVVLFAIVAEILCLEIGVMMAIFLIKDRAVKKYVDDRTAPFSAAWCHIKDSARPAFTSEELAYKTTLMSVIEPTLVALAARKVVFTEFQADGKVSGLSQRAADDFRNLFDTSKVLKFLPPDVEYGLYYHQIGPVVPIVRRQFYAMLDRLPKGEPIPLRW